MQRSTSSLSSGRGPGKPLDLRHPYTLLIVAMTLIVLIGAVVDVKGLIAAPFVLAICAVVRLLDTIRFELRRQNDLLSMNLRRGQVDGAAGRGENP